MAVRNNKGIGIWVPSDSVVHYVISGCRVYQNGRGFELAGSSYAVTGNVIFENKSPNNFGSRAEGSVVSNNVGT